MREPEDIGPFETWADLEPTLSPIIKDQVVGLFLPWSRANATAIEDQEDEFSVELAVGAWTQKPQKYHARSLHTLTERFGRQNAEVRQAMQSLGAAVYLGQTT